MSGMLANFYKLHGSYNNALKEYKKVLSRNPEDELLKDKILILEQKIKEVKKKRIFKCVACGLESELQYGISQISDQMNCPDCGSQIYMLDRGCGRRDSRE
ncbi:hypothetical protein ACFL5L_00630 [candidate division KSB1 bacterium]